MVSWPSYSAKLHKVTASVEQDHKNPKTWLGSDNENVLKLLSELMATVSQLATLCSTHTHPGFLSGPATTGPSIAAPNFVAKASEATEQKARLDPIIK